MTSEEVASERAGRPGPAAFDAEEWVSEGGWLVEILLPRTDAGVAVQAVVVGVVFALGLRGAVRHGLVRLWLGALLFTAGLFMLRAIH